MSTIKTTNLQHASASSANIILNSDGTVGGAALASASEIFGTRTTGSVTSGTTSLTVASATGISAGMFVVGEGITPGTTVSSIVSTTVTLSANANITLSSDPVTFYANNKLVSPGVIGGMLCRAWVNFNGTSTVDIRACYNVSSITDNGTGYYTVNFTTSLSDTNYVVQGCATPNSQPDFSQFRLFSNGSYPSGAGSYTAPATSNFRIGITRSDGTVFYDAEYIHVCVFR